MEAQDAADVFAQVVATVAAGFADAASQRPIHHHGLAGPEGAPIRPYSRDLAGSFGAYDERHLALGERHAAPAPDIDMVERNCPDADLHLAGARRRRRRDLDALELAIGEESERPHAPRHAGSRPSTSETFWPPKPKELESACRTLPSRATFGTTSSGIAGSGIS